MERSIGIYEKIFKRLLDILCASLAIIGFGWLYLLIALLVRVKLGRPILFVQQRPGKIEAKTSNEKIFKMYKFRTMTDEQDIDGKLLPDEYRLTKFGKWLRATSLDELPEVINILKGDMSIVGPRPQLVCDMVFMTNEQRMRHTVKPGLSGLAQVNGRNAITWEEKIDWDLQYIKEITFGKDVEIILDTVKKAFIKQEGIVQYDMATAEDYGDYLLKNKRISLEEYLEKQQIANDLLENCRR